MDLINKLKEDGISKGLCRLWQRKLTPDLEVKDLISLYVRGIDFCISEDFPTLEFLQQEFKGTSEEYGVYIDDDVKCANLPDIVLNGGCRAILEYTDFSVSRIYARHTTQAAINVSDHAILTIDSFDSTEITVATSGSNAKVVVNLYGSSKVTIIGSGIIVNKHNKQTY